MRDALTKDAPARRGSRRARALELAPDPPPPLDPDEAMPHDPRDFELPARPAPQP